MQYTTIQFPIVSTIALFMIFMAAIHIARPAAVYARDGSFRPFGVGYTDKTITPGWLVSGILAVFAYIIVHYLAKRY